ncbi:unnamed protein product [Danaus chrysippus]|uniref:(African queen) hypothetical protein n=1 Tax=Danaus chrysippus TaxID=151541 RepID=A0A8J2R987_9NEOP|nr:unnamed protein product [Danaus chrysippus]
MMKVISGPGGERQSTASLKLVNKALVSMMSAAAGGLCGVSCVYFRGRADWTMSRSSTLSDDDGSYVMVQQSLTSNHRTSRTPRRCVKDEPH